MVWILVCAAVFIAAFVMWENINPQLPELLQLPRDEAAAMPARVESRSSDPPLSFGYWKVLSDPRNVRISREFRTPVRAGEQIFYPPALHVTCYDGKLYAWIETSLRALESAPRQVAIRINNGPVEHWTVRDRNILIAPQPGRLLEMLSQYPQLQVAMAFQEAPEQTLILPTDGLQPVVRARLTSCQ